MGRLVGRWKRGFKNHYQGLAGQYQQLMMSKEANQRQLGLFFCRLEYENLLSALKICLGRQETVEIFFCLEEYLDQSNDIQSRLRLSEFVCKAQESYPEEIRRERVGLHINMALDRLAVCYLVTQNYKAAKATYEKVLEVTTTLKEVTENQKKSNMASTYHQLGRVAQELREYEQARSHYQQALDIKIEYNDRYSQASTYGQLAHLNLSQREYLQARQNFQNALEIHVEYGDRYTQALDHHNLGIVSQELREYEEARSHYQQSLDIYIEYKDRYEQAGTYHQLGMVSQAQREYEQARSHYQQALDIKIEYKDRYSQASTYGQLGILAEAQEDYVQAQQQLQQALKIFV
ncbi:MAG: tetratricopeptide repeat protein, partial [Cyanobacteria bacterium P01_A01_bin.137]